MTTSTEFTEWRSGTAPLVGRHKKNNSLVGFDPLLQDTTTADVATGSSGMKTPPGVEGRDGSSSRTNQDDVSNELRAIAARLESDSTNGPNRNGVDSLSPPRNSRRKASPSPSSAKGALHLPWGKKQGGHRKTMSLVSASNTFGKLFASGEQSQTTSSSVTPTGVSGTDDSALGLPPKKKQGGHHRKTRSLASASITFGKIHESISQHKTPSSSATPTHSSQAAATASMLNGQSTTTSPIIQELWDLQINDTGDDAHPLSLPSLSKPRPTSFLTGKEVIQTGELDATDWQVAIPDKTEFEVLARVSQFLDTYRTEECLLDLNLLAGCSRLELAQFCRGNSSSLTGKVAECHRPIVESLLECGKDISGVRGLVTSQQSDLKPHERREVLILESQNQFLCVFRGTDAEQQGKTTKQSETMTLKNHGGVTVFTDRCMAVEDIEPELFTKLDQLAEENPFCDIVFAGHSYGAAMATLAAYRYAWTRHSQRVAALVTASPKVGMDDFRMSVNSLSNLKMMRLEYGHGRPQTHAGCHLGHTIRIIPAGKNSFQVKAYRFGDSQETSAVRSLLINTVKRENKDASDYVHTLENLTTWVKDYYRQDGAGVRGKDNEERQMV